MSKSIDTKFWEFLGRKQCLLLGEECGSVAIWTFLSLIFRSILIVLQLNTYIPSGFYLAFPFLIQYLGKSLPFLREKYPLLVVRLTEGIMGRLSPKELFVVIPAHFLGNIIGIVVFKLLFPFDIFFPTSLVLNPMINNTGGTLHGGLLIEILAVFLYSTIIIVLPEIIEVNRLNSKLLSIVMIPIMFIQRNGYWCTLNPCIMYGLWYVNHIPSYQQFSGLFFLNGHLLSPIIGSILAGLFCNYYFPDNPTCWKRSEQRFKTIK